MRITAEIVIRDFEDPENEAKVKREPIRTHYDSNTGEAITTNRIEICRYEVDDQAQQIKVAFVLGGTKADGSFHPDLAFAEQRYTFSKKFTRALWDEFGLDDPDAIDIRQAIKMMLIAERPAIYSVARANWNLPNLEPQLRDDTGTVVGDYKTHLAQMRIPRVRS
jgi:hypothetical protein